MSNSSTLKRKQSLLAPLMGFVAFALLVCAGADARTLAEVRELGFISMCANPDALPYSSSKPETPGFQVELGQAIAQGLGLKLTTEWILPRRRANVVNCDMLFDRPNDPQLHEGRLLLSRPYQKSGMALGLARDVEPVSDYRLLKQGQKVGVMVSSVASVVLGKAGKTTSPYAFQSDMLEDLEKGELYAAAISSASLSHYIARRPASGLKLAYAFDGAPDLTWDVSIGLRKSDQALLDAVNEVLGKLISEGSVARIYAKYGVEHRLP